MPKEKTIARWLPLVGLTFAVFVFNTSEFMPIGLLSDIAADLHISEVRAGLLVSVYAWVVALMSLPLMVMVSTVELKRLLLAIIAALALFVIKTQSGDDKGNKQPAKTEQHDNNAPLRTIKHK